MRDFVRWTFTTTPPPPTPSPPKTAVSSPMSATRQPMQSATTSSQTLFQSPKKPTYRMDISPEKKPDEPKTGAMDGVTNVDDYGYDVEEEDDHEVIVFTGRQQQQQQQQQPQEHELGEDPVPKDGVPGGFTGMSFSSSAYEADSGRNGFGAMLSFSSTAEAMSGVVGASGSSFSPSSSNDGLNLLSKPAAIGSERRTSSSSISLNAGEGDENGTTDGVIAGNAALVTTEDAVVPKLAKQPSSSPIGPNSGDAKSTLANGLLGSGMGTLFGGTTVFSDIIARNQGNGSPTTSQTDVAGGGSPESLALQKSSSVPPGFVMQPSSSSSSVSSASIFAFPPGNENELRSDTITSASGVAKSKLTPPRDKPMPVPNSASSDRTMNVDAVNTISFLGLGSPPSGFKKAGSGKARGPASISGELKREEQRQESMSTLLTMGNAAPWMAVQPSFGMSSPNYTTVTPQGSIAYTGGMASSAMAYDNSNRIDGTDTAPRPFVIGLHQLPQQSWNSQQPFATVPAHQHPPGLSGMSSPVATSPLPGSIAVGTGLGGASWGSAVAKGSPLLSAEANKNFATYMASYGQNAPQYPVAQASTAMGWMSPASVGGLTGMSAVANGYGGDMRTNTAAVANTSWYGSAVAAAASAGVAATGGYPSFAPATHQMGGVYGYPNNTSQTGMMYPAVAGGSVPMGGGGSASAIGMSPLNFQQYQHVMPGMAPPPQQTMLQQQQSQRVGVNSGLQTDQNAYR
ncbi:hypothetical protein HK102_014024 [Quaeritorhiza haematococci]|nr:hypothetical protein HK102_014024 [Quaeritorhiza haematococci]